MEKVKVEVEKVVDQKSRNQFIKALIEAGKSYGGIVCDAIGSACNSLNDNSLEM